MIAALLAVGGGLGLVLAGPIVNSLDYHWLFWIPGVVRGGGGGRHPAAGAGVADPDARAGSAGWPRCCCPAGWSRCWSRSARRRVWGWGSAPVIGLLVAAVLLAVGWVVVEQLSATR